MPAKPQIASQALALQTEEDLNIKNKNYIGFAKTFYQTGSGMAVRVGFSEKMKRHAMEHSGH
jgi:hypothetical protein